MLNNVVGGFNPYAVEHTAAMGGKIVWLPTLAAENHLAWEKKSAWAHPATTKKMRPATAVPATRDGKVLRRGQRGARRHRQERHGAGGGHLHVSEIWLVFEEAKQRGVKRLVVNHPEEIIDASMNDVQGLTALGAQMEHSLCMFVEGLEAEDPRGEDLRKAHRGRRRRQHHHEHRSRADRQYPPARGFRHGIALCLDLGYSDADIRKMFSTNAAKLFGLEKLLPN